MGKCDICEEFGVKTSIVPMFQKTWNCAVCDRTVCKNHTTWIPVKEINKAKRLMKVGIKMLTGISMSKWLIVCKREKKCNVYGVSRKDGSDGEWKKVKAIPDHKKPDGLEFIPFWLVKSGGLDYGNTPEVDCYYRFSGPRGNPFSFPRLKKIIKKENDQENMTNRIFSAYKEYWQEHNISTPDVLVKKFGKDLPMEKIMQFMCSNCDIPICLNRLA